MAATIEHNGLRATITNGVWRSADQRFADKLQAFRDSVPGMQYMIVPSHFDSLDARGAVEYLGDGAKIIHADNDLPDENENTDIIH